MATTGKRTKKASGQALGYVRVSTAIQNTDRQLDGLELDRVFTDRRSGKDRKRPQLVALLAHLRDGDIVHVHSIDRLARDLADLLRLVEEIVGKGASLRFEKEGLTFIGDGSALQRMQLQMMGAVAEFERAIINERAAEGIVAAKARGVKFGRPSVLSDADVAQAVAERAAGKCVAAIALDLDASRQAVYRALERASA